MDTRTRLIGATQDLLWEQGYGATSPRDILERAQAGQGSMYHHFHGKQDLAITALDQSAQVMRTEVEEVLGADGSALERLEAYLARQRDSLRGCRMGRMTYDAEVVATPELLAPVADTLGWLIGALADMIGEGQAAGEFPATVEAHRLASTVVAVVQGGYVLARAHQDPSAFDEAIAGAVDLLRQVSQS